ncbi:amino acid adenylation domain-containing protein [Pseudomonas sp. KFB-139]|uniref:Amino acid adenylation domain-containing protein n=1 Tax=Pseudomonas serbiensis TaxID=3064350 RepID=A0ABT9CMW3_9PSED|nr:amino acid adenylation domain-containing protein [Pseudomonas sp. KFB-138]MDO7926843.1 amino acid adenylation domain-containing protein [Pseudomonas sp. KFB-138]
MSEPLTTIFGGQAYPVDFSLVEHIERIIEKQGAATAVFNAQQHLSYLDIRGELLKLHTCFLEVGLRPGDVIGVHLELQLRYPLIVLGVLLAGLVYLPIATTLPVERKQQICDIARPTLLVTDMPIPDVAAKCCTLAELFACDVMPKTFGLFPEPSSDATAYIIFTSGTTGVPKGVSITRKGFLNRLQWARDYYSLNDQDVTALKTPFSFDPSIQEAVLPFFSGGTVFVPDPGLVNFPNYLSECISRFAITMLIMVPSQLKHLLSSSSIQTCHRLRHIVCCGEPWGVDLVSALHERLPECRIYNGYGPTEATIGTLVFNPPRGYEQAVIPIGKPIAGTHVAIVNDDIQSVAQGEAGELIIGGICVGNGYVNNESLTAQKFQTLEVKEVGPVRFYLSGDQARLLPSGEVLFLGRKDNQIKINGVRIELEEIELALRSCPGVRDAVVIKQAGKTGDQLHAFLISDEQLDVGSITDACANRINRATIPSRFTRVDNFPVTHNGKVDRQELAMQASFKGNLP